MARPQKIRSITGATSAVAGDSIRTKGHDKWTLWVEASGIDPANDDLAVDLEGSIDGEYWAEFRYRAPASDNVFEITDNDLQDQGDGTYVAMISSNSFSMDYVRANIENYSDADATGGFEVDAYVVMTGWNGPANTFIESVR